MNWFTRKLGLYVTIALFVVITQTVLGQTTLSAGDIAIIGANTTNPDDFAFVLLRDISMGTVINFTDNGWLASGAFRTGEGIKAFTAAGSISAGNVIVYSTNSNFSQVSGTFSLATTGDQVIAFQGDIGSPTPIYGVNINGGIWQSDAINANTSALPSGLVEGTSALAAPNYSNVKYVGGNSFSTAASARSIISDPSNWSGHNTTPYDLTTWSDFSLPVTLSLWNATSKNGQVLLNWSTDSEIENLGFIIERALAENGPWNTIASFSDNDALKGQGSTNNATDYQFTDEKVDIGKTYYYRLSDVDYQGVRKEHGVISVVVSSNDQNALPGGFQLDRIFPNPFNPSVNIDFTLAETANIRVNLYDLRGHLVSQLTDATFAAGNHSVNWNGLTTAGEPAPSGVYLLQISDSHSSLTRKVVLAR